MSEDTPLINSENIPKVEVISLGGSHEEKMKKLTAIEPGVIIVAGDHIHGRDLADLTLEMIEKSKSSGKKIAIVTNGNESMPMIEHSINNLKITNDYLKEYAYTLHNNIIPISDIMLGDTPNKLKLLQDLKLTPEQIDYFQNAPPQRMEGETFENYKQRRMINKLMIKYRGQF